MLTKELIKYALPVYQPPATQRTFQGFPHTQLTPPFRHSSIQGRGRIMTKLEFQMFVNNLPFKKGDYVTYKHNAQPFTRKGIIYKVEDIDEIHHFVDWGSEVTGPIILSLSVAGQPLISHWKSGANLYKKVELDELPEELRRVHPGTEPVQAPT